MPTLNYLPDDNEIIYHYCSADTFNLICTNKKIRFCDLFTMNDTTEIHWGYSQWEAAVNSIYSEIDHQLIDYIDNIIHISGTKVLPLGACFSRERDLLSQWRGYADDGKGYVIGFNAKSLIQLPVLPLNVIYDADKQVDEIAKLIRGFDDFEKNNVEKRSLEFFLSCMEFVASLSAYKNPSFSEEKEIRLVHLLNFEKSNNFLKLTDPGGIKEGKEIDGEPVKFFMKNSIPVSYIDMNFLLSDGSSPIKEVIIGPKNEAMETGISIYLETLGLGNVSVSKSKAPYR